ncbi:Protein DPCD [Trachymyrmex zeteki]|uniref:Protein DPCD n=1 Tax=Mycetomoellerius zeteki TaxID=64791 RepID=A0A151WK57_9HYME|nr:Protein DPCD [Trachymyrmex zeteki]
MTSDSWLKIIQNARKTAVIEDGKRKVHFLMEDGKEMVEEYSTDTNVVVRRAWKQKNGFGTNIGWMVEVGDPELKQNNIEIYGIEESSNTVFNFLLQPIITRRITKASLEWRIRNLSYPESVYSITAEHDGTMTVRTSNKKYFKKIKIPDLERIGLKPEQERISFRHQYNTLIITYKKPPQLLDVEKKILAAVLQLKTDSKDVQCPTS